MLDGEHHLAGTMLLNPESWTLNFEAYSLPHALCATLYLGPLVCTLLIPQIRKDGHRAFHAVLRIDPGHAIYGASMPPRHS